jgi:DNA-binding NtrC family response regulator
VGIQKEYDVVLTDIRMPDIGDACSQGHQESQTLSPCDHHHGYANVQSAVQAMKLGQLIT